MTRTLITVLPALVLSASAFGALESEAPNALAAEANAKGDAMRGAIVFHQPTLACNKCHTTGEGTPKLGPDLTKLGKETTDAHIVESILNPSKVIRKGFESVSIETLEGTVTGLVMQQTIRTITVRDVTTMKVVTLPRSDVKQNKVSLMPTGLANQVGTRQQFLDLIRYLSEINKGGAQRAAELKPDASLIAVKLPEYEKDIDHAGMIKDLDKSSLKRGEAIYSRVCMNCHGTQKQPGSLPTALPFAKGQFKNGNDPYTMYQTLTHGFGMMIPQTWMVPEQKYDVIHYIREAYLNSANSSQYFTVNDAYLKGLPKGTTRGPKPSKTNLWQQMDYGPNQIATYEVGPGNISYKAIAVRLDAGPGGVSKGSHWMIFDHDTMRMAAAWSGAPGGFIDWNSIHFNGRHAIHPKIVGNTHIANPVAPGWGRPTDGSFKDPRIRGRDDKPYGPLPRDWAHYKGLYHHGQNIIVSYTVGDTSVLEMPVLDTTSSSPVYARMMNIGPRKRDMVVQVAQHADESGLRETKNNVVIFGKGFDAPARPVSKGPAWKGFNGAAHVEVDHRGELKWSKDYTIHARIKTKRGGTIAAETTPGPSWIANGKTFFIRGGRLAFDIGWVGDVQTRKTVNDDKWHDVAMTWERSGRVQMYIDGKNAGSGRMKPKGGLSNAVMRIGYTAPDFPRDSRFVGEMSDVRFFQRALSAGEIANIVSVKNGLAGRWDFTNVQGNAIADLSGKKHNGKVVAGSGNSKSGDTKGELIVAGATGTTGLEWMNDTGSLRLKIPAGNQPVNIALWHTSAKDAKTAKAIGSSVAIAPINLKPLTKGGPAKYPNIMKTKATIGKADGPFAIDVLNHPTDNPWFARMRLTGFDFYPDGDRAAVSAWDGGVYLVTGLSDPHGNLSWRRMASGLFQPLGVKIVDGRIYVTCRDQLVILNDLNGDGETDFYESFNNDHQVTEHFHEFAMGLQTDDQGNFYYAKSARHAKKAIVPHHGTLLRVSKDGQRTDILARGFRAANGVCLNPDGTFIVTDQEGHWNPKNRINYVKEGGFYGNMYGYHNVTDSSDSAMEQPLCWITNAFDRSPAELLWVDSKKWGPLNGTLLNLSYGYGKVYTVPHEKINGQAQGGMCAFPIPKFPTGVMRGRFHPKDGQLYMAGMFAWAGSQSQPGGLYRLRYTGNPVHLPIGLNATGKGMRIVFSGTISEADAGDFKVKTWSLKRTASYGSRHYNEKTLKVTSAKLSDDGKSVFIELPDIKPTWSMEISYRLKGANGENVTGVIHNTIHQLRK